MNSRTQAHLLLNPGMKLSAKNEANVAQGEFTIAISDGSRLER